MKAGWVKMKEILGELAALDVETAKVLKKIRGLV
jgi:hypothetical protein